jgi:hypothetical protein
MGDPFIASTQYNDLVGGAAFDGHDSPPLFILAEKLSMPKGYWPVGFELDQLAPNDGGEIPITLLVVNCEETGSKIDDIIKFAETASELHVYRLNGTLKPEDFNMFKRVDIKALRKDLPAEKVVIEYLPEE